VSAPTAGAVQHATAAAGQAAAGAGDVAADAVDEVSRVAGGVLGR